MPWLGFKKLIQIATAFFAPEISFFYLGNLASEDTLDIRVLPIKCHS